MPGFKVNKLAALANFDLTSGIMFLMDHSHASSAVRCPTVE
jgi:hypothetical protein